MHVRMIDTGRMVAACVLVVVIGLAPLGSALARAAPGGDRSRPVHKKWNRIEFLGHYSFRGAVRHDKDLSGIASISDTRCLVGPDEGRGVQVVSLSRESQTLSVLEDVPLLESGDEIDIEAIAAEQGTYYITGSHGLAKQGGGYQENRYRIFRLEANRATGSPVGVVDPRTRIPVRLKVGTLSHLLQTDAVLGRFFRRPLST